MFPQVCKELGEGIHWIVIFNNEVKGCVKGRNVSAFWDATPYEVRELYACADFHLSPSFFESFGLTHLEAVSMGLPTVGVGTGVLWDLKKGLDFDEFGVVEHAIGVICDRNASALAHGVRKVLLNMKCFNPRVLRDFVIGNYSIEICMGSYKKLISEKFPLSSEGIVLNNPN